MHEIKKKSNLVSATRFFTESTVRDLESALRVAFDIDTCYPDERKDWSPENPAYGQCAVTALVVQDYLGGDIIYDQKNIHFWNRVEKIDIDLSRNQFSENVVLCETRIRSRQELLEGPRAEVAETLRRYRILEDRVSNLLMNVSNKEMWQVNPKLSRNVVLDDVIELP